MHHPSLQPSQNSLNGQSIQVKESTRRFLGLEKFALLNPQKHLTLLGHIVLSTCLISGFLIGDITTSQFAAKKQKQWLAIPDPRAKVVRSQDHLFYYEPNDLIEKLLKGYQSTHPKLTTQQKEVLRLYYLHIATRAFVHADVMSHCYVRLVVTITLVTLSALVASLCLLFISRTGWEKTNTFLINLFITCAGIIIIYGGLALSLNYEKNVHENRKMFAAYNNLQNEMYRFLATDLSRDGQPVNPSQHILYLDSRLEALSSVTLELDTSEVLRSREEMMKVITPKAQIESK